MVSMMTTETPAAIAPVSRLASGSVGLFAADLGRGAVVPVMGAASSPVARGFALDDAMCRATSPLGASGRRGVIAFLSAGTDASETLAAVGAVASLVGCGGLGHAVLGGGGGVLLGLLAGVCLIGASIALVLRTDQRAAEAPLDARHVQPFVEAFREGDAPTRVLVATMAKRWEGVVRARGIVGQHARAQLAELAAATPQLDDARAKSIDAVAGVLAELRDENGRHVTELGKGSCERLMSLVAQLVPEDRVHVSAFLRERLFDGERPRLKAEDQPSYLRLYEVVSDKAMFPLVTAAQLQGRDAA